MISGHRRSDQFVVAGQGRSLTVCNVDTLEAVNKVTVLRPQLDRVAGQRQDQPQVFGSCVVDENVVALGSCSEPVQIPIVDLVSGQILCECVGNQKGIMGVHKMTGVKNSRFFVSAGRDGTARLWDSETGEKIASVRPNFVRVGASVRSKLRYSRRSLRVYFGDDSGFVFGWRIDHGEEEKACLQFEKQQPTIYGLALNEEREVVYVSPFAKRTIILFSPETSLSPISSFQLPKTVDYIGGVFYDENSQCVLVQEANGLAHVYDVRNTSSFVRKFVVGSFTGNSECTEIVSLGTGTFLSINMQLYVSKWTIQGDLLKKTPFSDHGSLCTCCLTTPDEDGIVEDAEVLEERIGFLDEALLLDLPGLFLVVRMRSSEQFRLFKAVVGAEKQT